MTPTSLAVSRVQRRNRDRYMRRLELPGERRARLVTAWLCVAGVVCAFTVGWAFGR